jgi:iron complex transport system substrate-binding protein
MKKVLVLVTAAILVGVVLLTALNMGSGQSTEEGTIAIVDSAGREVTVSDNLTRIGVVNTYTAEVMRALGVDFSIIVGVSGDFEGNNELWPELSQRPIIQTSAHGEPDIEAMLDLHIEALFTFGTHSFVDIEALDSFLSPAGIDVIGLDFFRYDGLYREIEVLGEIFGKQLEASQMIDDMEELVSMVSSRVGDVPGEERTCVVLEHHGSGPKDPVVRSSGSQWTDLVEMAGGYNLFGDEPGSTAHVDIEAIIEANPSVYILDGMTLNMGFNRADPEQYSNHVQSLSQRDGYSTIDAVVNERVYILSGEFSGPMMVHGLVVLAKIINPELFDDIDPWDYMDMYYQTFHHRNATGVFYYPVPGS